MRSNLPQGINSLLEEDTSSHLVGGNETVPSLSPGVTSSDGWVDGIASIQGNFRPPQGGVPGARVSQDEDINQQIYSSLASADSAEPPPSSASPSSAGLEVIQYCNRFDHLRILGEAGSKLRLRKLARVVLSPQEIPDHMDIHTRKDCEIQNRWMTEFRGLGKPELDFLKAKKVFDLPSRAVR